jgi:hypothetical protein
VGIKVNFAEYERKCPYKAIRSRAQLKFRRLAPFGCRVVFQARGVRVKLSAVSKPGWRNWQTQRTQNEFPLIAPRCPPLLPLAKPQY